MVTLCKLQSRKQRWVVPAEMSVVVIYSRDTQRSIKKSISFANKFISVALDIQECF